ncbi:MAG: PAS domain-containing protein [Vampirovibrionales bacterium]|nr:PAS domain-containing protein [Vampirovibrionales bacterium]
MTLNELLKNACQQMFSPALKTLGLSQADSRPTNAFVEMADIEWEQLDKLIVATLLVGWLVSAVMTIGNIASPLLWVNLGCIVGLTVATILLHQRLLSLSTKLTHTEKRYNLVVEGASAGLLEWDLSTQSVIYSQRLRVMLGIKPSNPLTLWSEFSGRIHPDDLEWVTAHIEQHLQHKVPLDIECRLQHATGAYVWVHGVGKALWDKKTQAPLSLTLAWINIHKRKQTEVQMNQLILNSQNILKALDESAIVAITNPNGVITHANDRFVALSGYTREELIGSTHALINSGVHPPEFFQNIWSILQQGNVWKGEICNRSKDGRLYRVDSTIVPFTNDDGEIYQYVAIRHDVTAYHQSQEDLYQATHRANKASDVKQQFLSTISHELRTPLNGIVGITHLLKEDSLNDEQQQMIALLKQSGEDLLGVVNTMLDYAEISSQLITPHLAPFNPTTLLETLTNNSQHLCRQPAINFTVTQQGLPPVLVGDLARIQQIVSQLLSNAFKFTKVGWVRMAVTYQHHNSHLVFTIEDTGEGMTPETIELWNTALSSSLGLALCKQIADALGATLDIDSHQSEGTCVTLRVPAPSDTSLHHSIAQPLSAISNHSVGKLTPGPLTGVTVLVTEDNLINQKVTVKLLAKAGATVFTALNGQEALEQSLLHDMDVILMDLQMPIMDGYEATQHLRHMVGTAHTPIIALTASALPSDEERCLSLGMNGYLSKPVNPTTLISTVQRWSNTQSHTNNDIAINPATPLNSLPCMGLNTSQ